MDVNAPAPAPDPRVAKAAPGPGLRFVARQPILTKDEKVFGYELLFRDGIEDYFCAKDPEAASKIMLDSSLIMGLDVLCNGGRAFVNCTRDMLLKDYVTLLPSSQTVVEILESVEPDDLVMAACQRLKEAGYMIALDDFAVDDRGEPLTDIADIIKVDVQVTTPEQRAAMVKRYGPWRCRMLAEKVETREEFLAAKKAGFAYFQGYFFRRPETVKTARRPRQPAQLHQDAAGGFEAGTGAAGDRERHQGRGFAVLPPAALHELRQLRFRQRNPLGAARPLDPGRARSPALGAAGGHAGRGTEQVERPGALRPGARPASANCSRPKSSTANPICFCSGLLSLMDAILELPMSEVLEKVPLDQETKAVLLGGTSHLRPLYQLMLAQESGDWQGTAELGQIAQAAPKAKSRRRTGRRCSGRGR